MRVCFVSPEVFGWGVYGGFGYVTRTLAAGLAARGVEVSVVTPRRLGQREVEETDGFTVYGYPGGGNTLIPAVRARRRSLPYYRRADADVYHSQEASYNTVAAQLATPDARHAITFQDPYDLAEWRRISEVEPRYKVTPAFRLRILAETRVLAAACGRADALYAQAAFVGERAKTLYGLRTAPPLLPNPVHVPRRRIVKAARPTVCFLARWDPQKRVEAFLDLADRFPEVDFVAMGLGHDAARDGETRRRYSGKRNLHLTGFVSEEEKSRILGESWALVNTSVREALPVSFLEDLAHEAVLVSGEDPEGLTSRFGFRVRGGDYGAGIRWFLASDGWVDKGREGRRYVEEVYEHDRVIGLHLDAYQRLLEASD